MDDPSAVHLERICLAEISDGDIPHVIVRNDELQYDMASKLYPVNFLLHNQAGGYIPVLDMPMMGE